jgi:hypothetical protein
LISVEAVTGGGAEEGSDPGKEIGAPVGAESARYFAIGCRRPQFALGAVVVGRHLGMIEKGEEVIADFGIAFSQALAMPVLRDESHEGIEVAFEPSSIFAAGAGGQIVPPTGEHDSAQQQRLHAWGEDGVARLDGILAVT